MSDISSEPVIVTEIEKTIIEITRDAASGKQAIKRVASSGDVVALNMLDLLGMDLGSAMNELAIEGNESGVSAMIRSNAFRFYGSSREAFLLAAAKNQRRVVEIMEPVNNVETLIDGAYVASRSGATETMAFVAQKIGKFYEGEKVKDEHTINRYQRAFVNVFTNAARHGFKETAAVVLRELNRHAFPRGVVGVGYSGNSSSPERH